MSANGSTLWTMPLGDLAMAPVSRVLGPVVSPARKPATR